MHFTPNYLYHVYNRSNEKVFCSDDNYIYFLQKTKQLVSPYADILAWCLMPNHFHYLLTAKPAGCELVNKEHNTNAQILSRKLGTLLSSYTQGFNKQNKRIGALFAHKTKAKCINELTGNKDYGWICFNYIHQNPLNAGLCSKLRNWPYSSFVDYANLRQGNLVNKSLAYEMFPIKVDYFEQQSTAIINDKDIAMLF